MEHIEFMGIPLEGTSKEFFSKLKNSATIYSVEKESDDEVICNLSFTGKWAHVEVLGNPVRLITVDLHYGCYGQLEPTEDEWKEMVSAYFEYKNALIDKYGNPKVSHSKTERESRYKSPDSMFYRGPRITSTEGLECYSSFQIVGGKITIWTAIKGLTFDFTGIQLRYEDFYNKENPFKPENTRFKDL